MLNFELFLQGKGPDARGRFLSDYMAFDDAKWEECHDHVQWAFPTKTKSDFNPNAPIVPVDYVFDGCPAVTEAIKGLMVNYLASLHVYPTFAGGLGYEPPHPTSCLAFNNWIFWRNHNMRRLTRLIECLGIFYLTDLQEKLYDFLVYDIAVNYQLASENVAYWSAAWENKQHLLQRS